MSNLRQFARRTPLGTLFRPRRFQAYCVGAPKSGTTSVFGMFSTRYRAGHEMQFEETMKLAISRLEGRLDTRTARRYLRRRDRDLRLEMDSCNHLALFVGDLAEEFPSAQFLLTLRKPRPWLESIFNQHLRVDVSNRPNARHFRELCFSLSGISPSRGEETLERLGLFPLEGYLRGWARHYETVLDAVPPDRLLVVETEKLSNSVAEIAAFLSIPPDSIDRERSRLHPTPKNYGVVAKLPVQLVEDKIALICEPVLSRIQTLIQPA